MSLGTALLPLLGPVLFLVFGWGLVEACRSLGGRPLAVRLAYGYVTGVAAAGALLYAGSHLLALPLRRPLLVTLFGFGAGFLAAGRPRGPLRWRPSSPVTLLPLVLGGAVTAGLFLDAVGRPVGDSWDGVVIWNTKARFMRDAGTVDAPAIREERWRLHHPQYPALMPLVQVAALETLGLSDDDRGVKGLYAAFFPALLVLVHDAARRRFGAAAAALAATAAALPRQIAAEPYGGAAGTYSDLPLACLLAGGLFLLFDRRVSPRAAALAAVLLAGATLTKSEGLFLSVLGIGAAAAARLPAALARSREGRNAWSEIRAILPAVAGPVLAGLLLSSWRSGIVNRLDEGYSQLFSVGAVARGLVARAGPILRSMAEKMGDPWEWGWLWLALVPLVVAGGRALGRRTLRPFVLYLPLAMVVPLVGYAVARIDPVWLVTSTWNRFLLQTSPFWLVVLAGLAREAWRRPRDRRPEAPAALRVNLTAP